MSFFFIFPKFFATFHDIFSWVKSTVASKWLYYYTPQDNLRFRWSNIVIFICCMIVDQNWLPKQICAQYLFSKRNLLKNSILTIQSSFKGYLIYCMSIFQKNPPKKTHVLILCSEIHIRFEITKEDFLKFSNYSFVYLVECFIQKR